jgi:hypothetical protein
MLNRAETKREVSQLTLKYHIAHALLQCCDEFVYALRRKETSAEKRRKLGDLALSEEEWNRVRLFCNLLQVFILFLCVVIIVDSYLSPQHADVAQQAFSAETRPTLHNALPAIEKMYSAWQKALEKPRYDIFKPALEAAMAKLDEYYQRTAESDAHIIAMGMFFRVVNFISPDNKDPLVLDPRKKFNHFAKNWDIKLQDDVKATVQKKVNPLCYATNSLLCTINIPFPSLSSAMNFSTNRTLNVHHSRSRKGLWPHLESCVRVVRT